MTTHKKLTGDPNCPKDVRQVKRLLLTIKKFIHMISIDNSINSEEDVEYDERYDNEEFEKLRSDNNSKLA